MEKWMSTRYIGHRLFSQFTRNDWNNFSILEKTYLVLESDLAALKFTATYEEYAWVKNVFQLQSKALYHLGTVGGGRVNLSMSHKHTISPVFGIFIS